MFPCFTDHIVSGQTHIREFHPDVIRICGTHDLLCIPVGNKYFNALVSRYIGHNLRDLVCLHLLYKTGRFNSGLYDTCSAVVPAYSIHHRLALCGIRRDILTHREFFILEHGLKISHLLSRIKAEAVILRYRSAVYNSVRGKQMYLIYRHKLGNALEFIKRVLGIRYVVHDKCYRLGL